MVYVKMVNIAFVVPCHHDQYGMFNVFFQKFLSY